MRMPSIAWPMFRCLAIALSLAMHLPLVALGDPLPLHPVWTTTYSRANSVETQIIALRAGSDKSAYLWCRTQLSAGGKEGTLAKMNTQAQVEWEVHLAHPSASNALPADIAVDASGILACLTLEFTNSTTGIMTASISTQGDLRWVHVYPGGTGVVAQSICGDSTGGVAVAGTQQNDSLLFKLDGDGNFQWAQVRDGPYGGYNVWQRVQPGLNGEVYTRGHTYVPAGPGVFNHLAYHSATGTVRWETTPGTSTSGSMITDSSGNAYLGDAIVSKVNAAGSTLWSVNTTGGPPLLLQLTTDEQHLFCAGSLRISGKFRYHMSKLSTTGALEWARVVYNEYNPPDSWQPLSAAADASNFSYVSGTRGLFLFAPDGNRYYEIAGEYPYLAAIGHNELFAGLNPSTIVFLSGFPAYSGENMGFYEVTTESAPGEVQSWVPTRNGQVVRVEFAEDLLAPVWTELPPIISTGLITEVRWPLTNQAATYRLRVTP